MVPCEHIYELIYYAREQFYLGYDIIEWDNNECGITGVLYNVNKIKTIHSQ